MPIGKHTQMSLEILHLSSQVGSGKMKCGVCIRWSLITNFLKDVWRLIVLVTVAVVLGIIVDVAVGVAVVVIVAAVIVIVVVVVVVWSFRYIVSMLANTCEGSSGKVPDIGGIELLPFQGKYDLVNYEIQFQDVHECTFVNDSKGGVECGIVDCPL